MKVLKKGFTLIELLAVIMIIVIIIAIAFPIVLGLIESSRIKAFRIDETVLVDTAQMYLNENGEFLPQEVGDIEKIYYTDIKANEDIKIIRDPKNREECFDISHVLVKKITETDYEYTPALACPNYISIDGFNLLKYYVDFNKDEDEDGLADGLLFYSSQNVFVPTVEEGVALYQKGVQIIEYVRADKKVTLGIEKVNPPSLGDIIYLTASYKGSTEIDLGESLFVDFGTTNFNINITTDYQSYSQNIDVTNESHKVYLLDDVASIGDKVYIKDVILINLTDIWGAGSELTKEQMDQMVNNMLQ